jgi:hypothetical protein
MQLSPSFITANEEKTAKLESEKPVTSPELSKETRTRASFDRALQNQVWVP